MNAPIDPIHTRAGATATLLLLAAAAPAVDVLILPDAFGPGLDALASHLIGRGATVSIAPVLEHEWDGSQTDLSGYEAVIHLNGATADQDMPEAGQLSLRDWVMGGGVFVHAEWNAYEFASGRLVHMRDLTLFDAASPTPASGLLLMAVPDQMAHPLIAGLPTSFMVVGAYNGGVAHGFAEQPSTVVLRDHLGYDAAATRDCGAGRVVGLHLAASARDYGVMSHPMVLRLYANAVLMADDGGQGGEGGEGGEGEEPADATAPVLTLSGALEAHLPLNGVWRDPGANASDDRDGDISAHIVAEGAIDTAAAGRYVIRYSVADAAGNRAEATRTVTVHAPPAVTCKVAVPVLEPGKGFIDVGLAWTMDSTLRASVSLSVTQDEALSKTKGISWAHDAELDLDREWRPAALRLRDDRIGNGDGRVYLIRLVATDELGQTSYAACTVVVPKNRSLGSMYSAYVQGAAAVASGSVLPVDSLGAPRGNG